MPHNLSGDQIQIAKYLSYKIIMKLFCAIYSQLQKE